MGYSDFEQVVRKGQLITPWGIGSIVPLPRNRSVMVAGLDMWDYGDDVSSFIIKDSRLCRYLGVGELREPPTEKLSGENTNLTIPAVRFPLWHYCPRCGRMQKMTPSMNPKMCEGDAFKSHPKTQMIPERFIAICSHGHIQDFPIMEWVHKGVHPEDESLHTIVRKSGGSSTTLAAVTYVCSCGAHRSMLGATSKGALSDVGVYCVGNRPWLGDASEQCGGELRVVQAGGSNVWFPQVKSSIWIPPLTKEAEIQRKLEENADLVELLGAAVDADGSLDSATLNFVAKYIGIGDEELLSEWKKRQGADFKGEIIDFKSEDDYRHDEYEALVAGAGNDDKEFSSKRIPLNNYSFAHDDYFEGITLVRKLRETRAFVGFSRVEPDDGRNTKERIMQLSLNSGLEWIPAIKVYGEGIFLQFDACRLGEWRRRPKVLERVAGLNRSYKEASFRWGREVESVSPEFVLIHTFAHLLINRLSFDCGYGSSSLRERIYCRLSGFEDEDPKEMHGVLIYTASGDSEGSLGGLVRMGEPTRLEQVIVRALQDARWCSSDPICSQSGGQGPDSCNLAACHNCALLPETCCENGNKLLDRLLVVNEADPDIGYFVV